MVPCTFTPSALAPRTFYSLHNGAMHMHTVCPGTMHFLHNSQWYHANAHHPPWYHAFFKTFTMLPCTCTPLALVPRTIHTASLYHVPLTFTMVPSIKDCMVVSCSIHRARWYKIPFTHTRWYHETFTVHADTTYHSHHSLWYSVNFTVNWNTSFYVDGKSFTSVLPFESKSCISLSFSGDSMMPLGSRTSILKWRGCQIRGEARTPALTDYRLFIKRRLYLYLTLKSPN